MIPGSDRRGRERRGTLRPVVSDSVFLIQRGGFESSVSLCGLNGPAGLSMWGILEPETTAPLAKRGEERETGAAALRKAYSDSNSGSCLFASASIISSICFSSPAVVTTVIFGDWSHPSVFKSATLYRGLYAPTIMIDVLDDALPCGLLEHDEPMGIKKPNG
jgi:hypothetical protein